MNDKATEIDTAKCERRLNSYIEMLQKAYEVDGYGLADLIGMNHAVWTRNMNAPWGKKRPSFIIDLAYLTGISPAWFFGME